MKYQSSEPVGLNLHIYPSNLVGASRIGKLTTSIQAVVNFRETHAVGILSGDLPSSEEISDGVRIVRVQGSAAKGNLGRILKVLLWQPRVYRKYREADVAVVAAHNVWVLPLAYRLSQRTGAVLVYNAHELETETIAIKGLKQRVAKFIERRYIKRVSIMSVVNEPIAEWYESHYPGTKPYVVTNTPEDDGGQVDLKRILNVSSNTMLYIHTGNLVDGRSIPLILQTFSEPQHRDKHVVFLGSGHLETMVGEASKTFENIHLLPPVAPNKVVAHVRGADAGLCLIENVSLSDRLSTPNKLMEALFAGIPVLSSDLIEARRLLGSHADRWVLISPESQLSVALSLIDKTDSESFQSEWKSLPTWEDQVFELVNAYNEELKD